MSRDFGKIMELAQKLARTIFLRERIDKVDSSKDLDDGEREYIMQKLGETSKEIAEELVISLRTVQKHRSNMIQKLALESDGDQWTSWLTKYREMILAL